jgi:hypothetical protein
MRGAVWGKLVPLNGSLFLGHMAMGSESFVQLAVLPKDIVRKYTPDQKAIHS